LELWPDGQWESKLGRNVNVELVLLLRRLQTLHVDISPKFGFPLAIRPKFQLNAIIERDADIEVMSGFREELLVLPIFWAQDGFSEPSEEMASQITTGLKVPELATPAGALLLVVCLIMLASSLICGFRARRAGGSGGAETYPLSQ
jgi:hypothetical protein